MPTSQYDVGDTIRFLFTFCDEDGTVADPVDPTIIIREPDGTETTYTGGQLTNPEVGVYYRDQVVDAAGKWYGRGKATNPFVTADEVTANAKTSAFDVP